MITHPLSETAVAYLKLIRRHPVPRQEVNPGLASKFEAEKLVECVQMKSPYAKHKKGEMVRHLVITDAGRAILSRLEG